MNLKNLYLLTFIILSLTSQIRNSSKNSVTNDVFPKYLGSNMVEEIEKLLLLLPENNLISFNDSLINVTLYNTSNSSFKSEKMGIDFKNCLTILQKVYDLDPSYDNANINSNEEIFKRYYFIIIKIELKKILSNETSNDVYNNDTVIYDNNIKKYPTNHIEYIIFDGRTKKRLNASYCNDLNIQISYPIINEIGLNLSLSKRLYEDFGFDVFDPKDALFNDFCMNFTSDKNTDLSIKQKRKIYYQNVSYCDENCTYIGVNYTTNKAICACEVKSNSMIYNDISNSFKVDSHNTRNETFNAADVSVYVNYKVLTCYKQVFNLKRLKYNFGSYAIIILFSLYTICIIHFYCRRKTNLMYFYQRIQTINKTNTDKNKEHNDNIKTGVEDRNKDNSEEDNNKIKVERYGNIIISDISCPPTKKKVKLKNEEQKGDEINHIRYRMNTDVALMENENNTNSNQESNRKKIKITSLISTINTSPFEEGEGIEMSITKSNNIKLKRTYSSSNLNYTLYNFDKLNKESTIFSNLNYSMELPIPNYNTISYTNPSLKSKKKQKRPVIRKKTRKKFKKFKIYNNFLNLFDINNDNNNKEDQDSYKENIIKNSSKSNNVDNNNIGTSTINREETPILRKEFGGTKKKQKTNTGKSVNFIKNIKNTYNQNNKNLFIDFNQMKFEIAILIDNRNFCKKYLDELRDKYIIFISIFKDETMFKQLIFSTYILNLSIDLFFNALFNSDDYIEKRYDLEPIYEIFINYPKEILSSFSSQFLVKLLEIIIDYKALELFIKRISIQNKKYFKSINYLMKKYEKKIFIYVCISYVLFIFIWYYCTAFCTTYQNTQGSLAYDSLESFVLNLVIPVPMSFLTVFLRHIAIKKLSKILFFISNLVKVLS